MPRKKGQKKNVNSDFTLNDCANAEKPVGRVKKTTPEVITEKSWEDLNDDDLDLVEETDSDGTKIIISKKKRNNLKSGFANSIGGPGIFYPEVVWYHISFHIKPEAVGSFAGINKSTYAITKRESFWRNLYLKYCKNQSVLPDKLHIECCNKVYGLRQRVIRALHYTYSVFKNAPISRFRKTPQDLENQRCVNVWYEKSYSCWFVFMKFKKYSHQRTPVDEIDIVEELGRVDANPEEGCCVLQISCQSLCRVPPLMGLTLLFAKVCVMTQELRHQKIFLGFHSSPYNTCKDLAPEFFVIIDSVTCIGVYDWWQPHYPRFQDRLPKLTNDEESLPVLKKDFFASNKATM